VNRVCQSVSVCYYIWGGAGAGAASCVEDGEEDEGQYPQLKEEMVPVTFSSSGCRR
jgi:hypothetical protein